MGSIDRISRGRVGSPTPPRRGQGVAGQAQDARYFASFARLGITVLVSSGPDLAIATHRNEARSGRRATRGEGCSADDRRVEPGRAWPLRGARLSPRGLGAAASRDPGAVLRAAWLAAVLGHHQARRHRKYRKLATPYLTPRAVSRLDGLVASTAMSVVDRLGTEGECDFITDLITEVASLHPLEVISRILGVPESDEPFIRTSSSAARIRSSSAARTGWRASASSSWSSGNTSEW